MLERLDITGLSEARQAWKALLEETGLKTDPPYSVVLGIYEEGQLVATGARDQNRLKCIAIRPDRQGQALFNELLSGLITEAYDNGIERLFLYTKAEAVSAFEQLGFRSLATTPEGVAFMENGEPPIEDYLEALRQRALDYEKEHGRVTGPVESIVMNANPFTLGHRALIENALTRSKRLHLFVISEDVSITPADIRFRLVGEGTADLDGIIYHPTDNYIISRASFPSYFLKKETDETRIQASLDAILFRDKVAPALGITNRTVGDEPYDSVTFTYNRSLQEQLEGRISLTLVPRAKSEDGIMISATRVRGLLIAEKPREIAPLVPRSTYRFFNSPEGQKLVESWRED